MANTSADRRTAARILLRVSGGAFASRLLGRVSNPGVRSRVLGVLRHLRRLDAALAPVLKKPVETLDPEVVVALRIGIFEIVELGVPAPVAGDGAVHLVRGLGKGRAGGLVNAVMRRAPQYWERVAQSGDPGLRYSHPDWLWQRWLNEWGAEAAAEAMASSQKPAPVWVWFFDSKTRQEINSAGVELTAHPWVPDAWRAPGNRLVKVLISGKAYAQDPASQLVAHIATALGQPVQETLLDLCAAPGGKTARAAHFGRWRQVVACDAHLGRLGMARSLFAASGLSVMSVAQDGLQCAAAPGRWQVVLLDAPCTGTGTLRRHPELRWRLKPGDIDERALLQRSLIDHATELVAPGGVLVYSTCSVEPEENEQHFEELPVGFERRNLDQCLPPGTPAVHTSCGGIVLRPQDLCDGFTIHVIRRTV